MRKEQLAVYGITDRKALGQQAFMVAVEASLKGGVTCLQLREKHLSTSDFLQEALQVRPVCQRYRVPLIINDSIEVALATHADGVHVGQNDRPVREVRALIGPEKVLGVSAQTVEQALQAERDGADYLGVGAVFPTGSKSDAEAVSLECLKAICQAVSIPVVAIGGISPKTLPSLKGSGICGIAVIQGIYGQPDVQEATRQLKQLAQSVIQG
ncbi:MAG: thiamine phosphate synthase [Opitutales bacterium]|nr:thiamine phosphate synthase [Opitutales bacterium]